MNFVKKPVIINTIAEIREAKLAVEQVRIEDVKIKKNREGTNGPIRLIAIAVPVFKIDGKPTPVPTLRMFFLPVNGKWKYVYQ